MDGGSGRVEVGVALNVGDGDTLRECSDDDVLVGVAVRLSGDFDGVRSETVGDTLRISDGVSVGLSDGVGEPNVRDGLRSGDNVGVRERIAEVDMEPVVVFLVGVTACVGFVIPIVHESVTVVMGDTVLLVDLVRLFPAVGENDDVGVLEKEICMEKVLLVRECETERDTESKSEMVKVRVTDGLTAGDHDSVHD